MNEKELLSAQQGELMATVMYREFASITKDEKLKQLFLDAAADEGKHASILSKYTNQKLKPNKAIAKPLGLLYRIMPKKILFNIIAKGEYSGGDGYKPHINEYPEFEEMMNDEYRHGDTFKSLIK